MVGGLEDWSDAVVGGGHDGDVSIVVMDIDGQRSAAFIPRGIQRLGAEGHEMMHDLEHIVGRLRQLSDLLDQKVEQARLIGMSWDSIGFCVGTSGEAARQRWTVTDDE